MPEDKNVLEEIQREVKGFGDNVKGLQDSMQKDLAEVRKLAEEAKGAPEAKAAIEALTKSVEAKHTAIEAQVKAAQEQADRIETAMKRRPSATDDGGAAEAKEALAFWETKAAVSGSLSYGNRPTVESIDRDGYKAWAEKGYALYLRADDRAVEAKALSVGSNPNGGYLVPTAQSSRIIQKIFESSPIRQLATIETIGTEALELPIDVNDMDAGWEGEEQAPGETSTPGVGLQRIPVYEMRAKPKATQKILEDAAMNVEAWLAGKLADKFARTEATAFVSGNGVNKPRGILSYGAGTGRNLLPQVVSGAATEITADVIVKMPYEIKSAYLANANWIMKRSTVQSVMLLKDGQGQYLWRPGLAAGQPATLGGYSIVMADDMPAIEAGSLPVAFGDFRRGYTIVDRLGITTLRDPYSAKPFVEFYSRKRVGGAVVDFDAIALVKIAAA